MIADAMNHPSQLTDKVQAYRKAVEIYFDTQYLKTREINSNFDDYSTLLKISQPLSMFFTKSIED